MTESEIQKIVSMTVDELINRKLIKSEQYPIMLKVVDKALYQHFAGDKNKVVSDALDQLAEDPYISVIYLQYRDRVTLEHIAELLNVDVSTIKRNKKRLIKKIYEFLNKETL